MAFDPHQRDNDGPVNRPALAKTILIWVIMFLTVFAISYFIARKS